AAAAPLMFPYAVAMSALAVATVLATYLISLNRRGFALPLATICVLEVLAIIFIHPNLKTVVQIVVTGHVTMFACVLLATLFSLSRPAKMMSQGPEAMAAAPLG